MLNFKDASAVGEWNYLDIAWKEKKVGSKWHEEAYQWYGRSRSDFVPERDAAALLPR